jgi:hypothetical protein
MQGMPSRRAHHGNGTDPRMRQQRVPSLQRVGGGAAKSVGRGLAVQSLSAAENAVCTRRNAGCTYLTWPKRPRLTHTALQDSSSVQTLYSSIPTTQLKATPAIAFRLSPSAVSATIVGGTGSSVAARAASLSAQPARM